MTGPEIDRDAAFHGWRAVAICFVILNVALGVNFAGYGALVGAIDREFDTSRALASAGVSMLTLSMGLMSPLVGSLMRKYPLKVLMAVGVVLNAAGLFVVSQTNEIFVLLGAYLLLVGPGFCLYAVIPCTAVIGNWFVAGRGRALGIISMPFGNATFPILAAFALANFGLSSSFAAGAFVLLALLPLILVLVDDPARIGQSARGATSVVDAAASEAAATMTSGQILRSMPFLVLTLAVAVLSAAGLVMVTQIVSLGMERGLPLEEASILLAGFGLAGVAGAPIFGWLSDRIGGGRAFGVLSFALIPGWLGLLFADTLPLLLGLTILVGICSNGIVPLFGATMGEWLGSRNLGLAMGLCYLLQIPFLFGGPPLAGAMFEATGGYAATIMLHVASFVLIGLLMLVYRPVAATVTSSPPASA
ncbi:hypothetical protein GCM10011371_03180 [Novosphingobium marinum]|uniref:MFS family permease n=1 Tax=Novosphingobium marinum TaxID=1514948 RepID=A0A7Z0BU80_9SPHN|nr:MFS transporter [Novosphingobium marinum]NYH94010.1 MFS family permease [Novosphingobium marinum]GGC18925.1 hypothetical protein GCM10011371_03180 [Novosphingobium marinum]